MTRAVWLFLIPVTLYAQGWTQWGQNPRHTGAVPVIAQKPYRVLGQFTYDLLADQIRSDTGGELFVHYMAPLVDGRDVFVMSRGASQWISCQDAESPCGAARWPLMEWGVTKLRVGGESLEEKWTVISSWKPPPDNGTGWEPVFHPALTDGFLYVPAAAGTLLKVDQNSGELVDRIRPFADDDPSRYATSPVTAGPDGSVYYTTMKLDPTDPWTRDVSEAYLVRADATGTRKVSFSELVPEAPAQNCVLTFGTDSLPWPPTPDARPPAAPCGSQRPGVNAASAIGLDGTIYVISRAHLNSAYGYLVAVNPDLTLKWAASLRNRLNDGCDVLVPPGECRAGSQRGVDPATNEPPAGRVVDSSTASPVIAPDGSILIGVYTRYNYARGHLFRFSPAGDFLNSYDFGWDITPAIYEHDGTWSVIVKDNFYPVGSYCGAPEFCAPARPRYSLTSLTADLRPEWSFENADRFEWCVNMVAVDREGVVYANSEDGNVYAIDRAGQLIGRIFLKIAIGAAYTPLAIGEDGRVYTQNDGTLFVTGEK